jgi:predicted Zn-dependent protease
MRVTARCVFTALLALASGALVSCAAPTKPKVATQEEIVRRDNAVGAELAARFEKQLKLHSDREVGSFLKSLAQGLSEGSPDLKLAAVGVQIIRDVKGAWRSFGLPGNRIYVSSGLIRKLEFENEVAAALAFELGHIQKRHLVNRLEEGKPAATSGESGQPVDFLGPSGVFAFSDEAELEAVDASVDLMYRAGYDPRGLLSIWQAYAVEPRRSPFDASMLEKLVNRTRGAITKYAPLRNPIVRSAAFIAIQKRIRKL